MKICKFSFVFFYITFIISSCSLESSSEPPVNTFPELAWQHTAIDSQGVSMVAAGSDGKVFTGLGTKGLYFSDDQGVTWKESLAYYTVSNMRFMHNEEIYAFTTCSYSGNIFRSSDGGITWQNLHGSSNPISCPQSIVFHPAGAIFIGDAGDEYSFNGAIYKTMDEFVTLEKTSFPDTLSVFCMSINSKNDIFAGTSRGMYRSLDTGNTWTEINDGLVDEDELPWKNNVSYMVVNPLNDHIFAGRDSIIYKSVDNGSSWLATDFHSTKFISSIVINKDGILFVSAWHDTPQGGVYYSLDDGNSWIKIDKGISVTHVQSIASDSYGYLYAGTNYGIYRTDKSTIK